MSFLKAQLPVARDTLPVWEATQYLKFPFAGGLNYVSVSSTDLNFDGLNDLIFYDRCNSIGTGQFKCFIKNGSGTSNYQADPDGSYFFPEVSNWALIMDFNGDQKGDLFASTSLGIQVFKNTSTPQNRLQFTPYKSVLNSNYNPGSPQPLFTNIYASPVGVPGIKDVDGDGDLDILTFSSQGVFIEWHKNMSLEKYGHKDSLIFELASDCWGKCSESNCQVGFNQCQSKPAEKTYHAGSCLTCIDIENDGDQDLLMGDVGCSDIQFAFNSGTPTSALITDTTRNFPNYPQKGNTQVIRLQNFPCAFVVDVDSDGKQDLLASPQTANSENTQSVWYYKNSSPNANAQFQFIKSNFLQSDMIDVGQASKPLLMDVNADGLTDLLISSQGTYTNGILSPRISYYQNTGTPQNPRFNLISKDWLNLSSYAFSGLCPAAGDVDMDGDVDLLIGTASGQIHWFENTAGPNQPVQLSVFKNNPFGINLPFGSAAPLILDVNADLKPDLLIGMRNGKLAYCQNTGLASAPTFSLISSFWGGIDVRVQTLRYGLDAFASPELLELSGQKFLLVGSVSGRIFQYSIPPMANQSAQLINDRVNFWNEGPQSTVCTKDINGDGVSDAFIGNASGGCSFFSSKASNVGLNHPLPLNKAYVFPQPALDWISLNGPLGPPPYQVRVFDAKGSLIMETRLETSLLNTGQWNSGFYGIEWISSDNSVQWFKCIK